VVDAIEMEEAVVMVEAVVVVDMVAVEIVMGVADMVVDAIEMEEEEAVVEDLVTAVVAADMETVVAVEAVVAVAVEAVMVEEVVVNNKNAFNQQIQSLSRVSLRILQKMMLHNFLAQLELLKWTEELISQKYLSTPTDKLVHQRVSVQLLMMTAMQLPVLSSGLMAII